MQLPDFVLEKLVVVEAVGQHGDSLAAGQQVHGAAVGFGGLKAQCLELLSEPLSKQLEQSPRLRQGRADGDARRWQGSGFCGGAWGWGLNRGSAPDPEIFPVR